MSSGNSDHNKGVEAWEARRKQWTTPNQHYYDTVSQLTANNEKYDFLIKQEAQRMAIYKQLVHNRQGLRTPVSLKYIIPVLVTGWQEDGFWPKGESVQNRSD